MMQKYFLVLGGSKHLETTILKIYKKYNLLLIDYYNNSPLKKYCKLFIKCDLRNKKQCLESIKKYNISAIISDQNDFAINTYGYLCTKLKLSGIDFRITNQFTNKYLCKKKLSKYSTVKKNIPKICLVKDFKSGNFNSKNVIVKPTSMQGSRYIYQLSNQQNLKKKINEVIKNNKEDFVVEEFIEGEIYTIDAAVHNNQIQFLTLAKKKKFPNSFIDKEVIYYKNTNSLKFKLLKNLNKKIIEILKLKNGITHGEYVFSKKNRKFYLVEIACRGGGSGTTDIIIPHLTNFSPAKFLINLALNKENFIKKIDYKKKYCLLYFLEPNYLGIKKKLADCLIFKSNNQKFDLKKKKVKNSEDRGPYFIISDVNKKELIRKKNLIIKNFFKKY